MEGRHLAFIWRILNGYKTDWAGRGKSICWLFKVCVHSKIFCVCLLANRHKFGLLLLWMCVFLCSWGCIPGAGRCPPRLRPDKELLPQAWLSRQNRWDEGRMAGATRRRGGGDEGRDSIVSYIPEPPWLFRTWVMLPAKNLSGWHCGWERTAQLRNFKKPADLLFVIIQINKSLFI